MRILLRPDKLKNYKKEYMYVLALLGVGNPYLLEVCKNGLIDRNELKGKERRDWVKFQKLKTSNM